MATKKPATIQDAEVVVTPNEPEYTVSEFAKASAKVFGSGVSPDVVVAAFRVNNLQKATKSKAKDIVTKFISKEVK